MALVKPAVLRAALLALAGLAVVGAVILVWVMGRLPASIPTDAPPYSLSPLAEVMSVVSGDGVVSRHALGQHRASLDAYLTSLAAVSPESTPARFPTADAQLAYWVNALHAMVLRDTLEHASSSARYFRTQAIGGHRLTRFALESRYLPAFGDARVWLAVFDGQRDAGMLDGAPLDDIALDSQLNEAARRFMRRPEAFRLEGTTAWVSPVLLEHRSELLTALPDGRKPVLLQVVWAFLPDSCDDGATGCLTRNTIDAACGLSLEKCQVRALPREAATSFIVD